MTKTQTTLSIDKITKTRAEEQAKKMHLTLSGVARILLNDFADGKIKIGTIISQRDENAFSISENREIDSAIKDFSEGKNIEGPFNSSEEFLKNLKN